MKEKIMKKRIIRFLNHRAERREALNLGREALERAKAKTRNAYGAPM